MTPYEMRLGRLFDSGTGRCVVVAFDHGLVGSVVPGGEDAPGVVRAVTSAGVEGVLVGPGVLDRTRHLFAHRQAPSVLLRCDLFAFAGRLPAGTGSSGEHHRVLVSPAQAAAAGADAVVMYLLFGYADGHVMADNAAAVAAAARQAHDMGLPLMVESVLWGSRAPEATDPESLAFACRFAAELGADVVKTQYTGDPASMRDVVRGCPVPVLVLGGPKAGTTDDVLAATRGALDAGARGVVYGRNVWQTDDPEQAARRIHAAVHNH